MAGRPSMPCTSVQVILPMNLSLKYLPRLSQTLHVKSSVYPFVIGFPCMSSPIGKKAIIHALKK